MRVEGPDGALAKWPPPRVQLVPWVSLEMTKIYEIGPLQLDAETRVLTHAGTPMALGARGVAVLAVLVSRANEYVSKAAIMDAAWPGLVVEDGNLAVQSS